MSIYKETGTHTLASARRRRKSKNNPTSQTHQRAGFSTPQQPRPSTSLPRSSPPLPAVTHYAIPSATPPAHPRTAACSASPTPHARSLHRRAGIEPPVAQVREQHHDHPDERHQLECREREGGCARHGEDGVRTGAECGGGCGLGMGSEVDGWPGGWFAGSEGWRCVVRGCCAFVVSGPGWRCLLAVSSGGVWKG